MEKGGDAEKVAEELGLIVKLDEGALEEWVMNAINGNPKPVEEYKAGNEKAIQFLMGQVMRQAQGKANPPDVIKKLKEKLSE